MVICRGCGQEFVPKRSSKVCSRKCYKLIPEYKDKSKVYHKAYRELNRSKLAEDRKTWQKNNKDYFNNYCKRKRNEDPVWKLKATLRKRVQNAIVRSLGTKSKRTLELLGCTVEEWKIWLEQQFTEGMSWDNHGDWEIDHRIPICSFDLTKPEEQLKAFHYTNTQPLWKEDNRKKSGKRVY